MIRSEILVIDDDDAIAEVIQTCLTANGYSVTIATDGEEAMEQLKSGAYPVVVSDIYIDQVSGLDILREARVKDPETAVILMTARGSVRTTVEAEEGGAFDYLAKPFAMEELLRVVGRACKAHQSRRGLEREDSMEEFGEPMEEFGDMVGFSPGIVEVYKRIARCARSLETVLIAGETGVGKELVARAIHQNSLRTERPFCPVDSGAIPNALWEAEIFGAVRGAFTGADRDRRGIADAASGGTIFFDEVGEIPLEFQSKLLRFLQEKEYRPVGASAVRKADVRVIAATNRNPERMVADGQFRPDLYYRLNVLRIDVPPLRERRQDIGFLARKFLEDASASSGRALRLDGDALKLLESHPWPGNVRELRNVVQRLVALGPPDRIGPDDLRSLLINAQSQAPDEPGDLGAVERNQILKVLEQTRGNRTRAAEILGIQRRTLYKKLARMDRERSASNSEPEAKA